MTVLTTLALATGLALAPAPSAGPHLQVPNPQATLDRLVASAEQALRARALAAVLAPADRPAAALPRQVPEARPPVAAPDPRATLDRLIGRAEPALRARSVEAALGDAIAQGAAATARECANARSAATLWAEQVPQTATSGASIR